MTKTALDVTLRDAAAALKAGEPPADQLDWLTVPGPVAPIALLPNRKPDVQAITARGDAERKRAAGRPKGSANLGSRQLAEMIDRAAHGNPLLKAARYLALEPEELATRLGCSVAAAFDRQQQIVRDIAPFIAARLAPVDGAGKAVVPILMQVNQANGPQLVSNGEARPLPDWARYAGLDAETVAEIMAASESEQDQGLGGSRRIDAGTDEQGEGE